MIPKDGPRDPKKRPDPIDVYVGNRVRARRLALGLSQTKLAAGLGLTFQQVQKYETGSNRIGASRLQHVATILKVRVEHFFEGAPGLQKIKGDAPSAAYISDFFANTDAVALVKAFTKIKHAKLRRHIVQIVREIAGG
jgi:transcriptional regulator with XRE-family HTH domain